MMRAGECKDFKHLQEILNCTVVTSMNRQFLGSLGQALGFLKVSAIMFISVKSLTSSGTSVVNFRNLKQNLILWCGDGMVSTVQQSKKQQSPCSRRFVL